MSITELALVARPERVRDYMPDAIGDDIRLVVGGWCVTSSVGHAGTVEGGDWRFKSGGGSGGD